MILLTVVIVILVCWLWTKTRRPYLAYNVPPFPLPPKPFIGHLLDLRGDLRDKLATWRATSGDIFSLDLGGRHFIVISGYRVIKEVLVQHAEDIPDAPNSIVGDLLGETNKGIIGASGDNWKEQRSATLAILRALGMGKNVMAKNIQEEVSVYLGKLAGLGGRPVDVKVMTNISVSNIICGIAVGRRFDHEDPGFIQLVTYLSEIVKYLPRLQPLAFMPLLRYLPGDFFKAKKIRESILAVNNIFCKVNIKKTEDALTVGKKPSNFIAAYLLEMKRKTESGKVTQMDEANLVAVVRALFVAGTETTSTTLLWCMLYLLHHPAVQEKAYQEIRVNVGGERAPEMGDQAKLVYLNAVIMETQRSASIAPFALQRQVRHPFEVDGYTFPKGSVVLPFLDSVLQDRDTWGDPGSFRPERFIDEEGSLNQIDEFIPFSVGGRVCLGRALARVELFLFLSALLHRFKLEPPEDAPLPPLKGDFGGTVVPYPFKIRFVERKNCH